MIGVKYGNPVTLAVSVHDNEDFTEDTNAKKMQITTADGVLLLLVSLRPIAGELRLGRVAVFRTVTVVDAEGKPLPTHPHEDDEERPN